MPPAFGRRARVAATAAALALALAGGEPARADPRGGQPVRLCLPDSAVQPFLLNDPPRLGAGELLMLDAARLSGIELEFVRLPARRCLAMVLDGSLEVALSAATPQRLSLLAFPMRDGQLDATRRLARAQLVFVRRRGQAVDWREGQIVGVGAAVIAVPRGFAVAEEALAAHGLQPGVQTNSSEAAMQMVALGRADLTAAIRQEAAMLQARPWGAELEILAQPLATADFHIAANPRFAAAAGARLQALWDAVARLREERGEGGVR